MVSHNRGSSISTMVGSNWGCSIGTMVGSDWGSGIGTMVGSNWGSGIGTMVGSNWGGSVGGNWSSRDLVDVGLSRDLHMDIGFSWDLDIYVGLGWDLNMNIGFSWDLDIHVGLGWDLHMDIGLSNWIGTGVCDRGIYEAVIHAMSWGNGSSDGLGSISNSWGSSMSVSETGMSETGISVTVVASISCISMMANEGLRFGTSHGQKGKDSNEGLHCDDELASAVTS